MMVWVTRDTTRGWNAGFIHCGQSPGKNFARLVTFARRSRRGPLYSRRFSRKVAAFIA